MIPPPDDPSEMVEDIEMHDQGLTDWEREFIDSISEQLAAGRYLSDRQEEVLTNIWRKPRGRRQ
jgi:hypothetical protein